MGNNNVSDVTNPNAPNSPETRITPANFAPNGAPIDGPNPREISTVLAAGPHSEDHDASASAMMYVWGQFIDHDLDRTAQDGVNHIDISIPKDDPTYPGADPISLTRFVTDPATGTAVNAVSGWMDASMVYGSDTDTANGLRLADGHMQTSDGNNLPIQDGAFVGGDVRVTENPDLTAITTLFVREHNFQVDRLHDQHPEWSGNQLYQQARAIVTAEIQNITYSEFLPHLLGHAAIAPYRGYNANADPRITQEFSTAAFRFGHSIVSGTETKLDNAGNEIASQDLSDAFFATPSQVTADGGIDALIRNFASDPAQANDVYAIDALRNLLTAPPDFVDLIAIDVQRERDLGLGTLNQTRDALGLSSYTAFDQITSDPSVAANLQQVFGSVDNVDLFMGGLAEDHVNGAMVGCTFEAILVQQFTNLRDGDPHFWENQGFDDATTQSIQHTTLADIVMRNTDTTAMQADMFAASERHPAGTDASGPQLVMGQDATTVAGGTDDDTIVAGWGPEKTLSGDGGSNVFVVSEPQQTVTIDDFAPEWDKIDLTMKSTDWQIGSSDGHATITVGDTIINLPGVRFDQIGQNNIMTDGG